MKDLSCGHSLLSLDLVKWQCCVCGAQEPDPRRLKRRSATRGVSACGNCEALQDRLAKLASLICEFSCPNPLSYEAQKVLAWLDGDRDG